jgi:hypothetical protein
LRRKLTSRAATHYAAKTRNVEILASDAAIRGHDLSDDAPTAHAARDGELRRGEASRAQAISDGLQERQSRRTFSTHTISPLHHHSTPPSTSHITQPPVPHTNNVRSPRQPPDLPSSATQHPKGYPSCIARQQQVVPSLRDSKKRMELLLRPPSTVRRRVQFCGRGRLCSAPDCSPGEAMPPLLLQHALDPALACWRMVLLWAVRREKARGEQTLVAMLPGVREGGGRGKRKRRERTQKQV